MSVRGAALELVMLCAIGCFGPRLERSALDGWHAVEVNGVRMVAETSARDLHELARDLAGFDAAFALVMGRQLPATTPTAIALIRDAELKRRFRVGPWLPDVALTTPDGSLALVEVFEDPAETRQMLFYQCTRLLLSRHDARVSRWFSEGLGLYFSTLAYRDGALVVGSVPALLLAWVVKRDPIPLAQLFAWDRETNPRSPATVDLRATSWAVVHLLRQTAKGRSELASFEMELAKGAPLEQAREAAFGRSFAQLDAELAAHLGPLSRGVAAVSVFDPKQVAISEPPGAVPLRRSEVARELAAIALAVNSASVGTRKDIDARARLARELLEIAAEEDPAGER